MAIYWECWTKLRLWELEQYERWVRLWVGGWVGSVAALPLPGVRTTAGRELRGWRSHPAATLHPLGGTPSCMQAGLPGCRHGGAAQHRRPVCPAARLLRRRAGGWSEDSRAQDSRGGWSTGPLDGRACTGSLTLTLTLLPHPVQRRIARRAAPPRRSATPAPSSAPTRRTTLTQVRCALGAAAARCPLCWPPPAAHQPIPARSLRAPPLSALPCSGMFVAAPSRRQLAQLEALLLADGSGSSGAGGGSAEGGSSGTEVVGAYAEQDLLNAYFRGAWRPLPHTFNAQKGIRRHHPRLWEAHWGEAAVLHITDAKPWQAEHPGAVPSTAAWLAACLAAWLPGWGLGEGRGLLPSCEPLYLPPHPLPPSKQTTSATPTSWTCGGRLMRVGCSRWARPPCRSRCRPERGRQLQCRRSGGGSGTTTQDQQQHEEAWHRAVQCRQRRGSLSFITFD